MSTDLDAAVQSLLLLFPRVVGRIKRTPVPAELAGLPIAPRHLSLFQHLLYDGPHTVGELARRLEVAPTTVSLMVGELSRHDVLRRTEDPADRRRTFVTIADRYRPAIDGWLAGSARAWEVALAPLTPEQRTTVVEVLRTYEREFTR